MKHQDDEKGISIGEKNITNTRLADDTAWLAFSEAALQKLINRVVQESKKYCRELIAAKTEVMIVTKKNKELIPSLIISVNDVKLEQAQKFKCLGTTLNWDAREEVEIQMRIALARKEFNDKRSILCNKNISFTVSKNVFVVYVISIFTYNSETWTISK